MVALMNEQMLDFEHFPWAVFGIGLALAEIVQSEFETLSRFVGPSWLLIFMSALLFFTSFKERNRGMMMYFIHHAACAGVFCGVPLLVCSTAAVFG